MKSEKLSGYALRINPGAAEHTYVGGSAGQLWPCWGPASGGTPICQGVGDLARAERLSRPQSGAGILYGLSGVCHQAANRILFPSGKTVSAAAGYRWSVFVYGTYGRNRDTGDFYSPLSDPWPELAACGS